MDVVAQGNTTLSCFPWLQSYRNGELLARWRQERDAILGADARLSEVRAGMLARAKLMVLIVDEYVAFEQHVLASCTHGQSASQTEEEEALYAWLVEQWNLRDHLMEIAQVSSYLPDEDLYRANSCEERWWEGLFSSLHAG